MNDTADRARMVGINHVALEVGDLEAALAFYRDLFEVELRGHTGSMAFLDMGDQFIALSEAASPDGPDGHRHFGLVVDDPGLVERRLGETDFDVEVLSGSGLDFRDPWGNRFQIVAYEGVQFTKAAHVLSGMDLDALEKTEAAIAELNEKGLAPPDQD